MYILNCLFKLVYQVDYVADFFPRLFSYCFIIIFSDFFPFVTSYKFFRYFYYPGVFFFPFYQIIEMFRFIITNFVWKCLNS